MLILRGVCSDDTKFTEVPIFDIRKPLKASKDNKASGSNKNVTPDFEFNRKQLASIHRDFGRYPEGEDVPIGSLAVVAYTISSYNKEEKAILSTCINWVLVVAADD